MAANADDGVVFFIDRRSAVSGAEGAWGVKFLPVDQLPELRQMSDLAWGIWRRVHPSGIGLDNINYFVVAQIVNTETRELIVEALDAGQNHESTAPVWPGVTWDIESEQGAAMLDKSQSGDLSRATDLTRGAGSANGIAIGYFLSQHKAQLGGNKYVYQVQVYAENEGGYPYMVFHVKDAPEVARKRNDQSKGAMSDNMVKARL